MMVNPMMPAGAYPPAPPPGIYTCPLSCGQSMTADALRTHIMQEAQRATQSMRRQYAATGISAHADNAADEISERYAALYREAVPGPITDWRDSDGLRGYADRTIRVIQQESDQ